MHIGFVAPLPPTRTGVASYADQQLRLLSTNHRVTVYLEDPERDWDPARCEIAGLDELPETQADVVLYHLGNSVENLPQVVAAMTGPPGVLELHDGSLHHLFEAISLGLGHDKRYAEVLAELYGTAGKELAAARSRGSSGSVELALFDLLSPVLRRHKRVIAHSKWAQLQIKRRSPGIDCVVIPHMAPDARRALPREGLGLTNSDLLVGHAGFVTPSKRPELMVESVHRLRQIEPQAKLVLLGADRTDGQLSAAIHKFGMADGVICAGYLSTDELNGYLAAMDVVIALRSPHVGESSGPIASAFAAGVPVVTQAIGAWAELPPAAAVFAPVGHDEAQGIADAAASLLANPARRARMGAAARAVASTGWVPRRCTDLVARALENLPTILAKKPSWLPDEVDTRAVIAVDARKEAASLRAIGVEVDERKHGEITTTRVGASTLVLWGTKNATMSSLGEANRCLEGFGKLLWLDPPKLASEALHSAGFTDGSGARPTMSPAGVLLATKTRLPASVA